jgi:hypothetical protein
MLFSVMAFFRGADGKPAKKNPLGKEGALGARHHEAPDIGQETAQLSSVSHGITP